MSEPPKRKSIKDMTKAERRALQEEQRANKQKQKESGGSNAPPARGQNTRASQSGASRDDHQLAGSPSTHASHAGGTSPPNPTFTRPLNVSTTTAPRHQHKLKADKYGRVSTTAQKPVPLLSHLTQLESGCGGGGGSDELRAHGTVHPAVMNLGLQFSEFVVVGGSARCLAMLVAFKKVLHGGEGEDNAGRFESLTGNAQVISDYVTPPGTSLQRNLTQYIGKQIDYLTTTRSLADSMKTAIRYVKSEIANCSIDNADVEAKKYLLDQIDNFIKEKISYTASAISEHAIRKINSGDVILTYAKPKFEGKILLQNLTKAGIQCTYVLTNGLGVVMKNVTKVIIGASALLANGAIMSRVGTAMVTMMASDANIPVIALCELYKFSDAVRLDSYVWNEIGDPDELVRLGNKSPQHTVPTALRPTTSLTGVREPILSTWRDIQDLKLLNIHYDITPASNISMVIWENGLIPPNSSRIEREREKIV
ncbi:Eukaryotic translation initiation factor 2B, subunit 4 delta, 67kDa [Irineochytrium annulatum]|nr:Eukaryotic translation initiation factor 2B, subunit 4 delta, 67kDa [Irineochytrium annulatum]